jgi:FAD/FMN-containing dehydrogenase
VVVALRAVEPDGSIIQTGAKVVKNAAGYDLCRILAGSFGSLAIITEVTFRASPRPAVIAHAAFEAPAFDVAVQAAAETHRQRSGASYLVAANWPRPCLHIGIAGSADGVAARLEAVAPTLERIGMRQSGQLQSYENLRDSGAGTRGEACARVYGRPSDLSALAPKLEALCDRVTCHVASGVVEIAISRPTLDRVLAVERALPSGDPRVWHRLPLAMKAHVDPWGPARPDRVWMARLKAAFDPSGTMSPCRFVGGL